MYSNLHFCNDGFLSLIDLTTMGDSCKRDDSKKIGKFDSGLKYALVILLRNKVDVKIVTNGVTYTFDTYVQRDEKTGKTKEVLEIIQDTDGEIEKIPTAFAINMGHEWKFWMAIRELYSNCLDESGQVLQELGESSYDTVISLTGNDLLQSVIDGWDYYFIDKKESVCDMSSISIYDNNDEGHLRIYKGGILVYRDKKMKSRYIYDYPDAEIDEMRVLKGLYDVEHTIEYNICNSSNIEFINSFFKNPIGEFENQLNLSNHLSSAWIDIINAHYIEHGEIDTYKSLLSNFKNDRRIEVGAQMVATQAIQYSQKKVEVQTPEKEEEVILSFEERIKEMCSKNGFKIEVPIIVSKIDDYTCIADISKGVIFVTEEFNDSTMWEIIKAQYRILHTSDPDKIFKDFAQKLKS